MNESHAQIDAACARISLVILPARTDRYGTEPAALNISGTLR